MSIKIFSQNNLVNLVNLADLKSGNFIISDTKKDCFKLVVIGTFIIAVLLLKPAPVNAENVDVSGLTKPVEIKVDTIWLSYQDFEKRMLSTHPVLHEKEMEVDKSKNDLDQLRSSALLPKFELGLAMGPAPGLEYVRSEDSVTQRGPLATGSYKDSNQYIESVSRNFDFSRWGPYFGMEFTVAQPLNVNRYRSGYAAAENNILIKRSDYYKEKITISKEAVEIYYGSRFAIKMLDILEKADADFNSAQKKMESLIEEESESVSQKDLLKLKVHKYDLIKGKNYAKAQYKRAMLGSKFYLSLENDQVFRPAEGGSSGFGMAGLLLDSLAPLDSLKILLIQNHPDLKRLKNGLAARRELLDVSRGELGPDIFLFGTFRYTKAWSEKRTAGGEDAFATDPLNELDGVAGLGMRINLNFWSQIQKYRKAKLNLHQLERTEVYALRALLIKLEEAYVLYEEAQNNLKEASVSLRAAEALLKGAAMDYDLDPALAKEMITPYRDVLNAKNDYYESVFEINKALGKVISSVGFTVTDFLNFKSKI